MEISYKDVDKAEWIEEFIQERVDKLQRLAKDMISCRVAVEMDHKRRQGGNPFYVRVETR
ncbi:MAG: HPF/RaiA family ribosome-associated protein [Desulfovermiculus sp.]|nr:HPF/RaiA family ribosome-associated protein [Desulfovermiculus sp.]